MAIIVRKTEPGGHIDQGMYNAVITDVKIKQGKDQFLAWYFKVAAPIIDGTEVDEEMTVSGTTSMKWTKAKGNKLNKLLLAAGIDMEEGEEFDVEQAVGSVVRIVVEDNPKDDVIYSKVTSVLPIPKTKTKSKTEPKETKEETKAETKPESKVDEAPPVAPPVDELPDKEESSSVDTEALFDFGGEDDDVPF